MNRDHDYGGGRVANQLRTLKHLGIFRKPRPADPPLRPDADPPLPTMPEKLPHLANYEDEKVSLNDRARSYLHSNCATAT